MMDKETYVKSALAKGLEFLKHHKDVRAQVRIKSKDVISGLLDAHWLAMSVIANATSTVSKKPGNKDAGLDQLLSLSASFIQGIDICETTISEGLYVSAAALLKQEMETISAIREVKNRTRKSGITPNVKSLGKFGPLYGDLNRIAHVSDSKLMQQLVRVEISAEQSGAPLFPLFNDRLAKSMYGLHVFLVTMIAVEVGAILEALYGEGLKEFECDMLVRAASILRKEGWLEV